MSIRSRLIAGSATNLLSKIWVLGVQLVAIPVLVAKWGADGYGIWLMISTVPTYIALSDFGMGTAAAVDITTRTARGDEPGALNAFQSVWLSLSVILAAIVFAALAFCAVWFLRAGSGSGPFDPRTLSIASFLMVVYACGIVQMSALLSIFQATHKYALGTALQDALVPVEGLVLIVIAALGGHILEVVAVLVPLRWIGCLAYYLLLRRLEPWVSVGYRHASFQTVRRLAHPSLAALSLTLSSSLGLQGVVLSLGWVAGASTVAAFGGARFLTRAPLQFSGLVTRASMPELTRAFAAGDIALARRLTSFNVLFSIVATVPYLVVMFAFGPALVRALSAGHLDASPLLLALLAIAATANALWTSLASPMLARNLQSEYAYFYLVASVAVIASPLLARGDAATSAAFIMSAAETCMIGWVSFRLKSTRSTVKPTNARHDRQAS